MKKVIGIDVDGTVVDTIHKWELYLIKNFGITYKEFKEIENDSLFEKDYFGFWRQKDLYDDLEPIDNAVETINKLNEKYKVVFISSCFEEHIKSKKRFLERHFDFEEFFVTSKKNLIKVDYIIDDYNYYLDLFKDDKNVECIKMKNIHNSKRDDMKYLNWKEIGEYLI